MSWKDLNIEIGQRCDYLAHPGKKYRQYWSMEDFFIQDYSMGYTIAENREEAQWLSYKIKQNLIQAFNDKPEKNYQLAGELPWDLFNRLIENPTYDSFSYHEGYRSVLLYYNTMMDSYPSTLPDSLKEPTPFIRKWDFSFRFRTKIIDFINGWKAGTLAVCSNKWNNTNRFHIIRWK